MDGFVRLIKRAPPSVRIGQVRQTEGAERLVVTCDPNDSELQTYRSIDRSIHRSDGR